MDEKEVLESMTDFNNALRGLRDKVFSLVESRQEICRKVDRVLTDSHVKSALQMIRTDMELYGHIRSRFSDAHMFTSRR